MEQFNINGRELFKYEPKEVAFVENGKMGWKKPDGTILILAEYEQIERCKRFVYLRKGKANRKYYSNGNMEEIMNWDDDFYFVEDGKVGWRNGDKIIIPARYDDIHTWGDSLFVVNRDGRWYYINGKEEEVLTEVRHIEGEEPDELPFNFSVDNNTVITIQEYVGHEVPEDKNVVNVFGTWSRLDRTSGRELAALFVDPADEKPLTEDDLSLFNDDFSYEFNAYKASSLSDYGMEDCLRKMEEMGAYGNTWHYLVKVWKAAGEEPSAEELRYVRRYLEGKASLSVCFALGHDATLESGETRMLMVTHYYERCWPAHFEYEWTTVLRTKTLEELKEPKDKLRKDIEESVLPEYVEQVWNSQFSGKIVSMEYSGERSWEETARVFDYLAERSSGYKWGVLRAVQELFHYGGQAALEKDEFTLKKIQWMLDHGAEPNVHSMNETPLDFIRHERGKEGWSYREEIVRRCESLLLEHGGKTMEEISAEESKNDDYRTELQRM